MLDGMDAAFQPFSRCCNVSKVDGEVQINGLLYAMRKAAETEHKPFMLEEASLENNHKTFVSKCKGHGNTMEDCYT